MPTSREQKYEQQKDLKRFLSIWDEHFVGWPDYDQRPAYKPEFETSAAEEFKEPGTTTPPLPPLKPLAVGLFGDVAVTHYFWPEADQSRSVDDRLTIIVMNNLDEYHSDTLKIAADAAAIYIPATEGANPVKDW
jgi:hypothetical protein